MIWKLTTVDQALLDAFESAGTPDQAVIDAYVARLRRPQPPQKHTGIKRYYYLMRGLPRISLAAVGRPLDAWLDLPAKVIVGTSEIIGEFPGNQEFVGRKGLKLQFQPIEWLTGNANLEIAGGAALLAEIDEQILDSREIQRSQRNIKRRYEWRKP